jgi:hypothetical protein
LNTITFDLPEIQLFQSCKLIFSSNKLSRIEIFFFEKLKNIYL